MAKLQYNEITPKRTVIINDDPYLVLSSSFSKKDRQKASNSAKLKNLRTGATIDRTFHQADVLDEAELDKRSIKYLYNNRGAFWFCDPDDPSDRFQLDAELVGDLADFVTENTLVEAKLFNEEILTVVVPIKVELKVAEASEAVKGNTSGGATKEVVLETGYRLQAPQFINQGDVISVNTETGEYSERVEKA